VPKKVKGVLFADYVRMLKSRKDVDWKKHLWPEDLVFLNQRIVDSDWYPFDTFERMGLAILEKLAQGNMDMVRQWGHRSLNNLSSTYDSLVCDDDPRESLMRFHVLRGSFFNFNAIDIHIISGDYAKLEIKYGMSRAAEEAATWQALGLLERLLELAGAIDVKHSFLSKSWEGAPSTLLKLNWSKETICKKVKGILFVDYVRMLKGKKDTDWTKYLKPDDMIFLKQRIYDSDWYPFDTFERMGVAILKEIADGNMDLARAWGRISIDSLLKTHESLLCNGDPMESLMRCQVLRRSFFDFEAIYLESICGDYAKLEIHYGMCKIAEEAATYQAIGSFERLLELSGATKIDHNFLSKHWTGDPTTILELSWNI